MKWKLFYKDTQATRRVRCHRRAERILVWQKSQVQGMKQWGLRQPRGTNPLVGAVEEIHSNAYGLSVQLRTTGWAGAGKRTRSSRAREGLELVRSWSYSSISESEAVRNEEALKCGGNSFTAQIGYPGPTAEIRWIASSARCEHNSILHIGSWLGHAGNDESH